jgi:3-carboxy-cis,cis-muconate cycloisomerase
MQTEVGEVAERGGGSSTMPHKRNPSGCAIVLAAAARLPGCAASMLAAMTHEHERAVGGWHAEAPILRDAILSAGSAAAAARDVIEGLAVSPERMQANLDATQGIVFAERLTFMLAAALGRDDATKLVADALASSHASGRSLGAEVRVTPSLAAMLTPEQLNTLDDPGSYLGSADVFRRQLIDDVRRQLPG